MSVERLFLLTWNGAAFWNARAGLCTHVCVVWAYSRGQISAEKGGDDLMEACLSSVRMIEVTLFILHVLDGGAAGGYQKRG